MDYTEVEKTMLVPLQPYAFDEKIIDSIQADDDSNGNVIYTIQLKADQASTLFSDRYDTYGLKQYDDYQVTSNKIVDTFDKDGYFISETTEFNASVSSSGQKVSIKYTSSVNYLKLNNTSVSISKDQKKEMKEYVYFEDIDTSSLTSDSQYDDTAEKTVTDTFKKRLVNRLGYEKAMMVHISKVLMRMKHISLILRIIHSHTQSIVFGIHTTGKVIFRQWGLVQ